MSPRAIGYALACLGLGNGVFQVMGFARTVKRFGVRNCYLGGIACAALIFAIFPAMSAAVRWGYLPSTSSSNEDSVTESAMTLTYTLLALQLVLTVGLNMCYGCVFIYINSAAASRKTLGATNGLAQMAVSVMRAVGPAGASGLFSLSLEIGECGCFAFVSCRVVSYLLSLRPFSLSFRSGSLIAPSFVFVPLC